MTEEKQAITALANGIVKAVRNIQGSGSNSSQSTKISGLPAMLASIFGNLETSAAQGDAASRQILSALDHIAAGEFETIAADTAMIDKVYATFSDFITLVADDATIGDLDVETIRAGLAEIGLLNISSAIISTAQIERASTGTLFVRDEVGGNVYIDDLAVSEANIVSLSAGQILLNDTNGDLVELIVDATTGSITTQAVSYDGNDVINTNSLHGNRIVQNSITADRLNASEIFAVNGTVMNLIVNELYASQGYITNLESAVVNSTIIGSGLNISGNSSITSITSNAGDEIMTVYISKAAGTQSVNAPSALVTDVTGEQNTWTLKRPVYSSSYPVLFVCTQKKAVNGTGSWTTPVKDDTTTVIDGGHITTGSIDANYITTGTLDGSVVNVKLLNVVNDNDDVIASFNNVITLGKSNNARALMDFNSFEIVDAQSRQFFYVGDLRDENGHAQRVEIFTGTGFDTLYVQNTIYSINYIIVDGYYLPESDYTFDGVSKRIDFVVAPRIGVGITVDYETSDSIYAYTLGIRSNGYEVGEGSFVQGLLNAASGAYSHAEGWSTVASGRYSHTEGYQTHTLQSYCHAEGSNTTAEGGSSHAEGALTLAKGDNSHAEGYQTRALGGESHAEGWLTIASGDDSHVFGIANIEDTSIQPNGMGVYVEIVGNGTYDGYTGTVTRSNARTLDWSGNEWIAGALSVGDATTTRSNLGITPANIGAATSNHTHTLSLAADSGTNQLTLAANGKYKLTAGGNTFIFTMPSSLQQKHPTLSKGTNPSTTQYYMGNFWTDINGTANGNRLGGIEGNVNTSGENSMGIRAYKYANGSGVYNAIEVGIKADGTNFYSVTDPEAFRSAAVVPAKSEAYDGNIDNLYEPGVYYLNGATGTGGKQASNKLWGSLLVVGNDNATDLREVQLHTDIWSDTMEFRRYNGTAWQEWQTITSRVMTKDFSYTATAAMTIGRRVAVVQQSLPTGITADKVKSVFISAFDGSGNFYVMPTLATSTLYISIYAASTSSTASCSGTVTVVY